MESNSERPKHGGFQKGVSGNPLGRRKGQPNHINKEVRGRFKEIVEGQLDNVVEALDRLMLEDPAKYIDVLTKLSAFFTPKLTEDLTKQKPPVFILPAGVEIQKEDEEDEEDFNQE